jgi:hypothetical protein
MAKKKSGGLNLGCGIFAFIIIFVVLVITITIVKNPDKFKVKSSSQAEIKSVERSDNVQSGNIDEQLLWETSDGVKITAKGLTYNSKGELREINVYAENNSSKNVAIGTDAIIINDYMISDLAAIKINAGSKTNDKIHISGAALRESGIENVGKIEMYLHSYNPDTYERLESSECITLKTTDYDKMDTEASIKGTEIISDENVKVYAQYVDKDSFWGAGLVLYIENNTDKIIHAYSDDTAVNGFTIDDVFAAEVYPGKKEIASLTFLSSRLEENGITDIDTIDFSLRIMDDDRNEIANSGKTTITAE